MLTERVTKNGSAPSIMLPEARDDRALRELAIKQLDRVRTFKLHAIAYAVGFFVLGGVWVLTEYFEEHSWPERFASAPDVAGTWDPWFFWAAGIWFFVLGVHAFKTFAHRPPSEAEIERELDRLRPRS